MEDTSAKEVVLLFTTQCWAQCCTLVGSAARIQQNSAAIRLPSSFCQEPRLWAAHLPLEGWFLQVSQPCLNVRIPSQLFHLHQLMSWKQQVFSGWSCLHWLIFFLFFLQKNKKITPNLLFASFLSTRWIKPNECYFYSLKKAYYRTTFNGNLIFIKLILSKLQNIVKQRNKVFC